jgi:hypothetical protein
VIVGAHEAGHKSLAGEVDDFCFLALVGCNAGRINDIDDLVAFDSNGFGPYRVPFVASDRDGGAVLRGGAACIPLVLEGPKALPEWSI